MTGRYEQEQNAGFFKLSDGEFTQHVKGSGLSACHHMHIRHMHTELSAPVSPIQCKGCQNLDQIL